VASDNVHLMVKAFMKTESGWRQGYEPWNDD